MRSSEMANGYTAHPDDRDRRDDFVEAVAAGIPEDERPFEHDLAAAETALANLMESAPSAIRPRVSELVAGIKGLAKSISTELEHRGREEEAVEREEERARTESRRWLDRERATR